MNSVEAEPQVLLEDQALRDGLQMETAILSLEQKLQIFEMLEKAGVKRIQVGSFVHPQIVPQMADTDELIRTIGRREGAVVSALVLNERGLERALQCGVTHASMSASVSDTHSRKNARCPANEAMASMARLTGEALAADLDARGSLQCVFGCVYEGHIEEAAVLGAAEKLLAAGATEVNLADTVGMANPLAVRRMVQRFNEEFPQAVVSLHLHDTRGLGLANMFSGYEAGVRSFDACTAGLGGCPFVKGAAGNVPTEDAVNLFASAGIGTGIDLAALCEVTAYLETLLGRGLPGHMKRVLAHQPVCI